MGGRCLLFLCAGFVALTCRADDAPEALTLTHAWSIEGPGRFDASGLMVRDGALFAVSDRHGSTIFKLELEDDRARAVPFVTFTGPDPYPSVGYMDLEGLAAAPDGGFYLAPEWGFAVCHVPPGGGVATWVTPDVRAAGSEVGLFATRNGYVEGLAMLGENHFLLAAERQPRGLVEVCGTGAAGKIRAQNLDASRYPVPPGRTTDFADLAIWRGRVFALARNQGLVVELLRGGEDGGGWSEGRAWSYAAAENAPEHAYVTMTYGQGEGLAILDDTIYVLLDSNNLDRARQPGDRRGWLFAFTNIIAR